MFLVQIIMAIISSWVICAIITAAGGFPSDPDNPNYLARTDRELSVLKEAKWFRFPYPGEAKSLMCATVYGEIFFKEIFTILIIREVKHDVYGKQQTAACHKIVKIYVFQLHPFEKFFDISS